MILIAVLDMTRWRNGLVSQPVGILASVIQAINWKKATVGSPRLPTSPMQGDA